MKRIKSSQTFLLLLVSCTVFMSANAPCCSSCHLGHEHSFHISGYNQRSQPVLGSQETVIPTWQAHHEKPALADVWDGTSSWEWTCCDLWNLLLRCHLPGLSQHGFCRLIRREWQSTMPVLWPCLSQPRWGKWKTSIAAGLLWVQTRDRRPHLIPRHQLSFVNLLICIYFFYFSLVCLPRHTQRWRNSYFW